MTSSYAKLDGIRDPSPSEGLCSFRCGLFLGLAYVVATVSADLTLHNNLYLAFLGVFAILMFSFMVAFYCCNQRFQIWALKHPDNLFSRLFLPAFSLIQSLQSCNNEWMHAMRLKHGPNFCCAGEVVVGEFAEVEKALTSPQARTFRLGQTPFIRNHMPCLDVGGRNVFLLAISDSAAGGNGDHEHFRSCFVQYVLQNPEVHLRRHSPEAKAMIENLAQEYVDMPRRTFFFDPARKAGLEVFLVRYYHYVMFGLELEDEALAVLMQWYSGDKPTSRYVLPLGYFVSTKSVIDKVAEIYEESPALSIFREGAEAHGHMTKKEVARLCTSIVRIAAKTGTYQLALEVMGGMPMPNYSNEKTSEINMEEQWDALNLENRSGVEDFIRETARLFPPVNCVHRVATEPLSVSMRGEEHVFPTGTLVLVPLVFGNLDKGFWGSNAYEFDANRPKLCTHFMGYHSVGDRHAGRECPGKGLSLDLLVDVLQVVGKARRAAAAVAQDASPSTTEQTASPSSTEQTASPYEQTPIVRSV